ncbi:hypothetical protein CGRA01v4_01434 [Colletotrichum graminicola]|nr:hypothetical protein CGRA01v4_01434 [Colletotrichum graminicola]
MLQIPVLSSAFSSPTLPTDQQEKFIDRPSGPPAVQ